MRDLRCEGRRQWSKLGLTDHLITSSVSLHSESIRVLVLVPAQEASIKDDIKYVNVRIINRADKCLSF